MRYGFSLVELIVVLAITAITLTLVIPSINRRFFGEEEALKSFLISNLHQSMKKNIVVHIVGDGRVIKSSTGMELDLPYKANCYIYPSGDIKYCWFEKGGRRKYYTNLDL
ncbi:MAG: type II secretion system GspH family protein [Aquificaceae bacterium]|nr:type II secretion system GspH family protein [Aquificaceae bacterium]